MKDYKNKKLNYEPPKFKRGATVKADNQEGVVQAIAYTGGENWYFVNGKYYGEGEITKV